MDPRLGVVKTNPMFNVVENNNQNQNQTYAVMNHESPKTVKGLTQGYKEQAFNIRNEQ